MEVKFWGVRGSVPKPPASEEIRTKIRAALERCPGGIQGSLDEFMDRLPPWVTTVVGGNTSCLEISDSTDRLIFDAGTGLAALGHQLIPAGLGELFEHFYARKEEPLLYEEPPCEAGCHLRLFMTHTHW
ncbi:MAG: hypothetical protein LBK52_05640, partial [Deltaproteobacteria bacterium]|nr:hypothetical protein [Deltaproteobacteria bacterium]